MSFSSIAGWIVACGLALSVGSAEAALNRFNTGVVPLAAGAGGPDGSWYYRVFTETNGAVANSTAANGALANGVRPLRKCMLLHGHGVTQQTLDILTGATPPKFPVLRSLLPFELADAGAYGYFGKSLIERLASEVCEEVYVVFRETAVTSIWEIALQTESFVKDQCKTDPRRPLPKGQRMCALAAHSKSAPAALTVARRCMDKTSSLGASICANVAEVYSLGGVNLGTGAATLLLGAKETDDQEVIVAFQNLLPAIATVLVNRAGKFGFDLTGDSGKGKNPTWQDLGPLAPMDNGKSTLYDVHSKLVLKKAGWWQGDYAASAGGHRYRGRIPEEIGFGTLVDIGDLDNPIAATYPVSYPAFSHAVSALHLGEFEATYNEGIRSMEALSPSFQASGHPEFTWKSFQESDGLVEKSSALGPCLNGEKVVDSAITSCSYFADIHHLANAGPADEVALDLLRQLGRVGR